VSQVTDLISLLSPQIMSQFTDLCIARVAKTDLVSHGVDELVHVSLQEVVEAGHAPEFVVLPDNLLAVLHSALSNTAV
jgi:hypothetical protein